MVILCGSAKAQYNETNSLFYNTFRTPQSGELNPALFPNKASFYLSLPGFGMQFGSPLAINDFMHTQGDSITVINLNKAMDALGKDNNIHFGINANLFGLGFKVNNMFFTFNSRLVTNLNINIPKELVDAVQHGNTDASGNPIPEVNVLCGDILNSTTYAEIAVGAGYRIEPLNLTVGARAKYLYGLANIQTDNTIAVITTAPDYSQIRADIYYDFITAGVAGLDSNGRFKMDTKNLLSGNSGFAFDIGARYDLGPFTFSFAINDLSAGIHWKNNVTTWTPSNGQGVITFNGLDVNSMLDNGTFSTDSLTAYLNEQLGGMTPHRVADGDYWFAIPTKINLGASFSFAKIFRAGLLFHGQLDRGLFCKSNSLGFAQDIPNTFRWNTTLSLGANLFNWAEVVAGNSVVYDGSSLDVLNPGIGLVLTPATIFQVYVMADYLSSFYLTDSKALNVKFGINLLFGKGSRTVIEETVSE
jgi:hypothetical protein